jgi:hypothetical protein
MSHELFEFAQNRVTADETMNRRRASEGFSSGFLCRQLFLFSLTEEPRLKKNGQNLPFVFRDTLGNEPSGLLVSYWLAAFFSRILLHTPNRYFSRRHAGNVSKWRLLDNAAREFESFWEEVQFSRSSPITL